MRFSFALVLLVTSTNAFVGQPRFAARSLHRLEAERDGASDAAAAAFANAAANAAKAAKEAEASKIAEEQKEATRIAAEQKAASDEAARKFAEEEARIVAETKAAEEAASKAAAEEAARIVAATKAAEEAVVAATKAAEEAEAARIAAEKAAVEATILASKQEAEGNQRGLLAARVNREKVVFDKRAAYAERLRSRQADVAEALSGTPEAMAKYSAIVNAQDNLADKCFAVLCALGMHDTPEDVPDPESEDYGIVHGHLDDKPWVEISQESDFFWQVPVDKYLTY